MIKDCIKNFIVEEEGIGVVEIILILVILIGLVLLFKEEIEKIVTNAFESITEDSEGIVGE